MAAVLAGVACQVQADPVTYVCTSTYHSGVNYMTFDDKLKTVWLGRTLTDPGLKGPAFFNRDTITWTHLVGQRNWNYSFDRATGVLTYGWGTGFEESQQDTCKKK